MVLSEAEAESRLAALRREREALDRAIADLSLYLELGRRLTAAPTREPASAAVSMEAQRPVSETERDGPKQAASAQGTGMDNETAAAQERARVIRTESTPETARSGTASTAPATPLAEHAGLDETKAAALLSEGALARRYGRALVREAVAVLEEAGRPLHASEILAALSARGFAIPGQQDPVAGLNTRLWKRSGPGGPLRRLGDAIYAPAKPAAREADPGEL